MNKFVGWGLVVSAGLGIAAFVLEVDEPTALTEALYTFAGLGLYVFGIWAAVLLVKKQ